MNVFDFDKTIFRGDSTAKFYAYCFLRTPKMLLRLPKLIYGALFILPKDKQRFKEQTFAFLTDVKDVREMLDAFWKKHQNGFKPFYADIHREDDLVISASPYFIVRPAMEMLGIKRLIASPVDMHTGKYGGPNCHGEEKVIQFRRNYPDETIENFYSDSHSDDPMAAISQKAWLVKGDKITPWHI